MPLPLTVSCTVVAVCTVSLSEAYLDGLLHVEFQNVKAWAATNCLKLNHSKTKEIVFKRPRVQYFHMPPPLVDIEQLETIGCNLSI